jgi:alkyl sulfatase BDS1-like metallo-beta-lactamase superfamily hydrolase
MGGIDKVLPRAREDFERGEFRWVAQLMSHAVFADPSHQPARELAADAFEQLAYQAESATWRNSYVLAARELRAGKPKRAVSGNTISVDMVAQLPIPLFLDYLAIRVRGIEAAGDVSRFDWEMTDEKTTHRITLSNGALSHRPGTHGKAAQAIIRADRLGLAKALGSGSSLLSAVDAGLLQVEGDCERVRIFMEGLDTFAPVFAVVEP